MDNNDSNQEPIRLETGSGDSSEPPPEMLVISQSTIYYFLTAVMFFVAGLIVGWVGSSTAMTGTVNETHNMVSTVSALVTSIPRGGAAVAVQPTQTPVPRQKVDPGDGPAWGPADAKVTVVEFSDFQCPYCELFYQQTYPLLKKNYGDKIRFVFRNFPLPTHQNAMPAALAAECANEQGKFWDYHDVLFSNQNDLTRDGFLRYADQVGIADKTKFTQCYDSQKYLSKIQTDMNAGEGYFVAGTPTFYINGVFVEGAQPYSVMQEVIEYYWCEAEPTHPGCSASPVPVTVTPGPES
ncbi:MAG TPA: DsbA family protein [Aggregatilineales bacterium]|nr:DsbA family protein [Aggregatilineales bacterium]